jgi:signal transduction histidine kinase
MKALGEAATHLAWLCPSAASLVALARSPTATVWEEVRDDPGAVLLILRQAPDSAASPASFFPNAVREPGMLLEAARLLESSGPGYVDWRQPTAWPIYHTCRTFARLASGLAERSGRGDPDNAWAAGLLAPLGWLAVAAISPDLASACLADPELPAHSVTTQQKHWGFDHAGIARRLARRWHLPRWLVAVAGHLDLRVETAQILGADPDLFRLVQLAVALTQRQGITLHLSVGGYPEELAAGLGLTVSDLTVTEQDLRSAEGSDEQLFGSVGDFGSFGSPPSRLPLLRDLLKLAAEKRQLGDAPVIEGLESDLDQLHRAFQEQRAADEQRLHARKLEALAEFAAGAGHEINNPLAVISGQAQYLLQHESDAAKQKALQAIVGQTQRIHQILNEMMQFARPTPPVNQPIDLPALIGEVTASLNDLAALRRVRLICPQPPTVQIHTDPQQLKTVLGCLLRNAIEAAPADGWAGVRVQESGIGNQESGIRNQESAVVRGSPDPAPGQSAVMRGSPDPAPGFDRRSPESRAEPEVKGQRSEVRSQESGDTQSAPIVLPSSLIPHPSSLRNIELIVEDSGPGPEAHQREHMFDPFYSGREAGRGRGLGLSIAWRLARQLGGDIRFEEIAGGPTRFVLSLPMQASGISTSIPATASGDMPAAA